jgi:YgiT-type zinc finger domain-containing protein
MRCTSCNSKRILKPETKTLKYEASGLDNVIIRGAKVYHCDNCGENYVQYGNLEEIDAAIADILLKKKAPLTGKEIRFLRTWKGYSGVRFASFISQSSAHLYRIEASNKPVNSKFDRLVRLAILTMDVDRNYEEIHEMLEGKKEMVSFRRIELKPHGSQYSVQYA